MRKTGILAPIVAAVVFLMPRLDAIQSVPPGHCRIEGRAMSAGTPIPGVAVVLTSGDAAAAATSTDTNGQYQLTIKPGAFRATAELTGFVPIARDLEVTTDN